MERSGSESYGMVVVESFILRKPVVVAKYPAIYEIMENCRHGLIAEQSVENITECIVKMMENCDGISDKCNMYLADLMINNDIAYQQLLESLK